jgi:hypothetical protein
LETLMAGAAWGGCSVFFGTLCLFCGGTRETLAGALAFGSGKGVRSISYPLMANAHWPDPGGGTFIFSQALTIAAPTAPHCGASFEIASGQEKAASKVRKPAMSGGWAFLVLEV